MAKTDFIELRDRRTIHRIPIVYEDRSILAVDKPRHWMLVPFTWQRTNRNLQAAITSSIAARDFWARSRNLKSLRYVHRLDADTTGILLFAKNTGAARAFGELFESRQMEKRYLTVVEGVPPHSQWVTIERIGPHPQQHGRMVLSKQGKDAETRFRVVETRSGRTLVEAQPLTGRTHQIRIHLMGSGFPVVGDELYGRAGKDSLALRAVELSYQDPFTGKAVCIRVESDEFLEEFGFAGADVHPAPPAGEPVRQDRKPPLPEPPSRKPKKGGHSGEAAH